MRRGKAVEDHDARGAANAGRSLAPIRVRLLGGFRVSVGSRDIAEDEWRLRNAGNLIKLLALSPGHRLHREQVTDQLWPELAPKAAANNLHQALHVARRTLEPDTKNASRYLSLRDGRLALYPDGTLWVDVEAFEEAGAGARRARVPTAYRAALDLYAGDLLPGDPYEDWLAARRAGLRGTYLSLLVEVAGLYEERGELGSAVQALRRLTAEEPAHEGAHAGLMRLYALSGRRGEALGQYERLREALSRDLDVEPGAEVGRLRDEISAGRVPVTGQAFAVSAPERPSDAHQHNLPGSLTSFVGREGEVVEVKRSLAMTRLLTLTGPGGSGKTRLALEVARDLVGAYPDGVWLAELAPLSEGESVPRAVARALGAYEQPHRPLVETLVESVGANEALLVLDNCEHLVDACARLVETLLESCPRLRVLATSREALGVGGEVGWSVPPLPLPDPGETLTVEELEGYGSARLFVERALYRPSAFVLTHENTRAVADVCRRLEGNPLAIELAAARVGTLPVEQISERLGDSLRLLKGGARTATPRQRTLRGALDWSYELLNEPERRLFDRLSVFAGGWTLEAAEAVAHDEDEALDLLSDLVSKSLVVAETSVPARYRLLEFVRQYGRERLEERGEADEARRRHALWYLELAEEAERGLRGPDQREWLGRLEREHPNFTAALAWSLDAGGDAGSGLRLAAALWPFWETRGHLVEGRGWLEKAVFGDRSATMTRTRAKALNGAGYIALTQGDYGEAKALLEEGLGLFRGLGDEEGVTSCLTNLGFVTMFGMRDDLSIGALLEEAMVLRPKIQDHRTLGNLLIFAGMILETQGDEEREMALHEESLALLRETKDVRGMSMCLTSLGMTETRRGNHDRALALLRENLLVSCELDKKYCIAYSFFGMADVALEVGQPARAARLWAASESVREAAGIDLSPLARSSTNYDGHLAAASARLGRPAFTQAWAEGLTMTQEEAVEYALSGKDPPAPVTKKPAPGNPPDALTEREGEVAALVTRGLSNRQIARELSISEHTAATHVRRVLRKLNLSSRTQLAAWMVSERR